MLSTSQAHALGVQLTLWIPHCVRSLTKPFQSVGHGLIFHHVDQSPPQAEVGEDEEDRLQDFIDVVQLLKEQKPSTDQPPALLLKAENKKAGRLSLRRVTVLRICFPMGRNNHSTTNL